MEGKKFKTQISFLREDFELHKRTIIETAGKIESKYEEYHEYAQEYIQTQKQKKQKLKEKINLQDDRISSLNMTINEREREIDHLNNDIVELKSRLYNSEQLAETLREEIRTKEIKSIQDLQREKDINIQKSNFLAEKDQRISELLSENNSLRDHVSNSLKKYKNDINQLKSSFIVLKFKTQESYKASNETLQIARNNYANIFSELNKGILNDKLKLSHSEEIINSHLAKISNLNINYNDLESKYNITYTELLEKRKNVDSIMAENHKLTIKYEEANKSLDNSKNQLQSVIFNTSNEKKSYETHIKELKEKLLAADHKIAFSTTEAERLKKIEEQLNNDYEELQKEYSDYKSSCEYTIEQMSVQIEEYKSYHFQKSDLETTFNAQRQSLEADIMNLNRKLKESYSEIDSLKEELRKSDEIHAQRIKEIKDWKGHHSDGVNAKELEKLKDYDRLKKENFELKEKNLGLNSQNNKLLSENSSMLKDQEYKSQEIADLRDFLEQLKTDSGLGSELSTQQRLQIKSLQEKIHSMELEKMLKEEKEIKIETENDESRKKIHSLMEQKVELESLLVQNEEKYKGIIHELQDSLDKYKEALSKINTNVSYSISSSRTSFQYK